MKKWLEVLKNVRKTEWLMLALAAAALILMTKGGTEGADSATERRLASILRRVEGVGSVQVMVSQREDGTVAGVLVAAEGAEDLRVCLRLQYALETLLEIDGSQIEIMPCAR